MSPETFAFLVATALVAGFIDAVAGGGAGLLTVPALASAGLDPISAIATNKLQGSFGTGPRRSPSHGTAISPGKIRRRWQSPRP